MWRIALTMLVSAAAMAVPAAQGENRDEIAIAKRLRGLQPGQPQACITPSRTRGSTRSGDTVLIEDVGGVRYLSRFRGGCSIRSGDATILRTTSSRLCEGEIVEGRDFVSGMSSGACIYGEFTPYRKPRR